MMCIKETLEPLWSPGAKFCHSVVYTHSQLRFTVVHSCQRPTRNTCDHQPGNDLEEYSASTTQSDECLVGSLSLGSLVYHTACG